MALNFRSWQLPRCVSSAEISEADLQKGGGAGRREILLERLLLRGSKWHNRPGAGVRLLGKRTPALSDSSTKIPLSVATRIRGPSTAA